MVVYDCAGEFCKVLRVRCAVFLEVKSWHIQTGGQVLGIAVEINVFDNVCIDKKLNITLY